MQGGDQAEIDQAESKRRAGGDQAKVRRKMQREMKRDEEGDQAESSQN